MVNRAGTEVEAKESTQTNANGFNVVGRKPKKGASGAGGDGADVQVTNVPAEFGDADVLKRHHLFGKYGRVVKINIVAGATKGKNATVSVTVTYSTPAEAGLAAHCVDGASLSGQTLSAKSSSPSPTTERPIRPNSSDVKFLPAIPKSLQPTPPQNAAGAASETTKPSEVRKGSKTAPTQTPAPAPQTQQKPITTAAIAPGVSAWSKPLATSVSKGGASYSAIAGSSNAASPTNSPAVPAASAAKSNNATSEQSPTQASPTFGGNGKQSQPTTKQQPSTATTAAAIVRGNKGASPTAANGVVGGSVTLPAALSKFATVDASVAFGGDVGESAPKMSNILDQPAPTGQQITFGTGTAPAPDRGLFDADQHISSVLSDSGAIDNTPPRPSEVSQSAFDPSATTRQAPQVYANANGATSGQNQNRNSQRRPGSGARGPRRNERGQGSPMTQGLSGPPVSPVLAPQVHTQAPPNFNMGRTKLNPEAPEFYPNAVRNPGLPGGIPLNDGRGMYGGGGMYDPQYAPFQGGPQVPWGYPPAGARGAPPFGGPPRGGYPPYAGYTY